MLVPDFGCSRSGSAGRRRAGSTTSPSTARSVLPPGDNEPPVIEEIGATPTAGFAPLEVDSRVRLRSRRRRAQLQLGLRRRRHGGPDGQIPTHTYTEAGEHEAELTVSDGEAEETDSVTITVLGEDDPGQLPGARVLGDGRVPPPVDRRGSRGDRRARRGQRVPGGRHRGLRPIHRGDPGRVRHGHLPRDDGRRPRPGPAGRVRGLHPGRRRLRRHPSASDTEYDWNWYGHLVGAYFISHPPGTATRTIRVEDDEHPSTAGLPDDYQRVDEWYNFKSPTSRGRRCGLQSARRPGDPDPGEGRRDDVRRAGRQRDRRRPSDDVVPALRRWAPWYTAMGHRRRRTPSRTSWLRCSAASRRPPGSSRRRPAAWAARPSCASTFSRSARPSRWAAGHVPGERAQHRPRRGRRGQGRRCGAEEVASIVGRDCVSYASIAAGESETGRFKVKAKRKAAGKKVTLRFITRAANVDRETAKATLKVKKKKKRRRDALGAGAGRDDDLAEEVGNPGPAVARPAGQASRCCAVAECWPRSWLRRATWPPSLEVGGFAQAQVPAAARGWTVGSADGPRGPAGSPPASANWWFSIGHGYPGALKTGAPARSPTTPTTRRTSAWTAAGHPEITPLLRRGRQTGPRPGSRRTAGTFTSAGGGKLRIEARSSSARAGEARRATGGVLGAGSPFPASGEQLAEGRRARRNGT